MLLQNVELSQRKTVYYFECLLFLHSLFTNERTNVLKVIVDILQLANLVLICDLASFFFTRFSAGSSRPRSHFCLQSEMSFINFCCSEGWSKQFLFEGFFSSEGSTQHSKDSAHQTVLYAINYHRALIPLFPWDRRTSTL